MPQIGLDTIDAVTLPGDVAAGKVDPMSNEGIGRGLGLASLIIGSGAALPEKAVARPVAKTAGEAAQFDIPLTRGQTSQDLRQLTKEENLRQVDGPAQTVMRNFDQQQKDAISMTATMKTIGRPLIANPPH